MSERVLNVGLIGGGGGAFIVNPHQKAISLRRNAAHRTRQTRQGADTMRLNGDKMRTARKEKRWTQREAAKKAGIALRTWQRAKRGQDIKPETAGWIAQALEKDPAELVAREDGIREKIAELEHDSREMAGTTPEIVRFRDSLERGIVRSQTDDGHWIDSVTTTSSAIVALSDYASTGAALQAIRKGIDWVIRMQHPTGAWGRCRARTTEDEGSGEMPFDPDWPHTVYALWAQLRLGEVGPSCLNGLRWLRDRYPSEKGIGTFAQALDLITLAGMSRNQSDPEYQAGFGGISLPRWAEVESQILRQGTFWTSELKSLYRYMRYACVHLRGKAPDWATLASHVARSCRPWEVSSSETNTFNFQTTALRILVLADPEEYRGKALDVVKRMLCLDVSHDVCRINMYDTVGLLARDAA